MRDLNEDFYRHISSEFNEELEALRRSTLEMGGLVEEQLASALKFFASQDSSLLSDIESIEQKINAAEIDLDDQVKKASARRRKLEEENPEMLSDTLKAQEELEKPSDEFNPDDVDLETLFGGSKQD